MRAPLALAVLLALALVAGAAVYLIRVNAVAEERAREAALRSRERIEAIKDAQGRRDEIEDLDDAGLRDRAGRWIVRD